MDNNVHAERQAMEMEVLSAIYGDELKLSEAIHNQFEIDIKIDTDDLIDAMTLCVTMSSKYPEVPAEYNIKMPHNCFWFSRDRRNQLLTALTALHDKDDDGNILKAIEWVRENAYSTLNLSESEKLGILDKKSSSSNLASNQPLCPTIYHSWTITDRKSKFQAHFSSVLTNQEVERVIEKIASDHKFSKATHPCIYAWKIEGEAQSSIESDNSDDGEGGASQYLVNLLNSRNIQNAVLMVTRWYGGINLGPDRFTHINSIAKGLLDAILVAAHSTPNVWLSEIQSAIQSFSGAESEQKSLIVHYYSNTYARDIKKATLSSFLTSAKQSSFHRIGALESPIDGRILWKRLSNESISIENPG